MGSVYAKVENIGPDGAKKFLDRMIYNRNVSPSRVTAYAVDMRSGSWDLNGQAIVLDENGLLLDGQHRLLAIIESGVTLPMLVVRGMLIGPTIVLAAITAVAFVLSRVLIGWSRLPPEVPRRGEIAV